MAALLVGTLMSGLPVFAAPITEAWLQQEVDQAREDHGLVALGAVVDFVGEPPVIAVSGTAYKGADEPVSVSDHWHIGSNTKALTALLYARLVEDGEADWGASVYSLFADRIDQIDAGWKDVSVKDLFAHRSGVGQLGPLWLIARHVDKAPLDAQRLDTARKRLAEPPSKTRGDFEYSNLNYIIAGAAIEQMLGTSWEEALRTHIFEAETPDGSDGWGFGPPQTGLQGHARNLFGMRVSVGRGGKADNPSALGPAGTVNAALGPHAALLLDFVDEDSDLITPDMRAHLLTPWPEETADYAMGWGVAERETLGTIYAHQGSNTMWLSHAELVPTRKAVFVINANEFSDASQAAIGTLATKIEARLAGLDPVDQAD